MKAVKIGVIGCGVRMRNIIRRLTSENPELTIAYIADPSSLSIEAAKALFPDASFCADYKTMLDDPEVEWILIGSWNAQHCEHAVAALQSGKHVFCEKPLATNVEDCLAIRRAQKINNRQFFFGLVLRYSPHYQAVKRIIDSGELGRIISMEFNETLHFDHGGFIHSDWRCLTKNAGTHLLEKCCHDIDLVQWLLNDLPVKAASFGGCDFFTPRNANEMDRVGAHENGRPGFSWASRPEAPSPFTVEKDIVDNQVVILEFSSGIRATFHTNCATNLPERRMYICGTRGTLRADVIAGIIEVCRIGYGEVAERRDTGVCGGHGGADEHMVSALANSILRGTPPLAGIDEGLRSTLTVNAIDEAMELNRVVDVKQKWRDAGVAFPLNG